MVGHLTKTGSVGSILGRGTSAFLKMHFPPKPWNLATGLHVNTLWAYIKDIVLKQRYHSKAVLFLSCVSLMFKQSRDHCP